MRKNWLCEEWGWGGGELNLDRSHSFGFADFFFLKGLRGGKSCIYFPLCFFKKNTEEKGDNTNTGLCERGNGCLLAGGYEGKGVYKEQANTGIKGLFAHGLGGAEIL